MSDPRSSGEHVDLETLAAYVDKRLDVELRAQVETHLADCDRCRGVWIGVASAHVADRSGVQTEPAVTPKEAFWTRRRRMAAVAALVPIAASIVFIVVNRATPLAPLVSIVGDERLIVARPTGGFHYGPLRPVTRGTQGTANLSLLAETARLRERAAETGATTDLQAAGVAQLLTGEVAGGVATLESAASAKPQDASIQADLGAGYMTRFIDTGNQVDGAAALAAFDRALELDPKSKEAWFNKAVLLMRLGRTADARSAWNGYLALPSEPGWRDEAVRQRQALLHEAR